MAVIQKSSTFERFLGSGPNWKKDLTNLTMVPTWKTLVEEYSRGLHSRARFERDETRLQLIFRIGGTGTRLMFSGLVTRENSGKIQEINVGTSREILNKPRN